MALSWFFQDEATPYTTSVRKGLNTGSALIPPLWHYEIVNTLYIGWKRERCTMNEILKWIKRLDNLPIIATAIEPRGMMNDWIALAIKHEITVYDASYLLLSWEAGLPIASLDNNVIKVALSLGIDRYDPDGLL
jgi:predicted nucleic acid-binding protein